MTEQANQYTWPQNTDFTEIPVSMLDVGNRALNIFRGYGIKSYADLLEMEEKDLTDLRGFGPTCLQQVVSALASEGLKLKHPDYAARR